MNRTVVRWLEIEARRPAPPLDTGLTGWDVLKRRKSHWNARRTEGNRTYHLKWFFHRGWSCPGRREWKNARRIDVLGIPTVVPIGWGRHPKGSFVVLEGSPGLPAEQWRRERASTAEMRRCVLLLASYVARLHDAGLCHRDLNVYHVLIDDGDLRLIDVGRVTSFLRRRWIVKDLASLLASARREDFPKRFHRLFLRGYLSNSSRVWRRRRLLRAVDRKARRYRRHIDKTAS